MTKKKQMAKKPCPHWGLNTKTERKKVKQWLAKRKEGPRHPRHLQDPARSRRLGKKAGPRFSCRSRAALE